MFFLCPAGDERTWPRTHEPRRGTTSLVNEDPDVLVFPLGATVSLKLEAHDPLPFITAVPLPWGKRAPWDEAAASKTVVRSPLRLFCDASRILSLGVRRDMADIGSGLRKIG